jgi:hypothetical protein
MSHQPTFSVDPLNGKCRNTRKETLFSRTPLNQEAVTIEQQHARIEARKYHVLDVVTLANQLPY